LLLLTGSRGQIEHEQRGERHEYGENEHLCAYSQKTIRQNDLLSVAPQRQFHTICRDWLSPATSAGQP
jgi:hypothetical protein